MAKKMLVRMGKNGACATEFNPRRFIGPEPVEVIESAYYHRRIADGDLELVATEGDAPAKTEPKLEAGGPAAPATTGPGTSASAQPTSDPGFDPTFPPPGDEETAPGGKETK